MKIRGQGKFTTKATRKHSDKFLEKFEQYLKDKESNMNNTDHNCEDNVCTNCDGEFHHSFCTVCGKDMGVTNCEGD